MRGLRCALHFVPGVFDAPTHGPGSNEERMSCRRIGQAVERSIWRPGTQAGQLARPGDGCRLRAVLEPEGEECGRSFMEVIGGMANAKREVR